MTVRISSRARRGRSGLRRLLNWRRNDRGQAKAVMRGRRRSAIAAAVFLAFTTPLGIAAHLISELAGLGWHDDADVVLSARHAYLGALALVAFVGLLVALFSIPRGERRARVAELVESLPFGGRGLGFTVVSFLAQFAFFAVTQIGEGCPLCGGDVFVGVVAAALAALFGAIAVALGKRRILDFVLALAFAFAHVTVDAAGPARSELRRRVALRPARRRAPFAFRYRPPPSVQPA
jgi:formate hydrogenlyase subunit 3/multisubunit Na+/H+ antiporter MnhD subunit